jgi:hypothetical protein
MIICEDRYRARFNIPCQPLGIKPRSYTEWSRLYSWNKLPEEEHKVWGFRIRYERTRLGLSIKELSDRLNILPEELVALETWGIDMRSKNLLDTFLEENAE